MIRNIGPQSALVTIQYVNESRTKAFPQYPEGKRRFVIGAERTTGDSLMERLISLTTLDEWQASLCEQARSKGMVLAIKFRETRYFDRDLLWVGQPEESQVSA